MSEKSEGTHGGHLTPEARHVRSIKNARNRSRRGDASRPRGSERHVRSRLARRGSANRGR